MVKTISGILFVFFALLLTACSNSRHLPTGESLFRGSKVHILDHEVEKKKERKSLENDLAAGVRPKTNSKTLGVRLKLSIYNLAGDTKKKKGLRRWLRNKVGEPPVSTSSVNLNYNKGLMVNYLQNRGYFGASVSAKIDTNKKKKATAVFEVATGPQYKINKVYFEKDSSEISNKIDSQFSKTLLTPGAPYNLELIKGERSRIDAELKESGYFFFKPDYILDIVDSSIGDHKVNMYLKLKKKEIPEEVYEAYFVNDIYIYTNYKLHGEGEDTTKANAVKVGNYNIIDIGKDYKPELLTKAIIVEKGDEYSLDDQNLTLKRLINMGVFKFVKNRYQRAGDSLLDVYYYLTPYPKRSLQFQVGAITQNDDRAGTNGSVSWKDRNMFKGGEQLLVKVSGGFEEQYSGVVKEPNIYNLSAETDLSFPRFVVPFMDIQTSEQNLPRSIIKLKYNFESESDLLRINSYTASYGYDWKTGRHTEQQFYPFNFTYVKTDTLGNAADLTELYGNLVFNGIIIGPTYEFSYNSQTGSIPKKNAYFFDGLIDLSGNILGLAENASYQTNPQTLLGATYAQYIKLQPDFRYYHHFSNATWLATRIMAGIGIPYGNSEELPNIKQFWAGGNSDLRGFPSRLVGPGTFDALKDTGARYIETLGDLKLEFNAEIRQRIYSFVNCAFFYDMGNIWLFHSNPNLPGGVFTSDFYQQLAADVGFGLRFDFKILILRLDLGMPVLEPWQADGQKWVFNRIDLASGNWRRNNLIFNIGIGYPF